jgi:hypothetical protein
MAVLRLGVVVLMVLAACRQRGAPPPSPGPPSAPAPAVAPAPPPPPPAPPAPHPPTLLYIKIPEPLGPVARGKKYEAPIDELLRAKDLGGVTGGGTMLSRAKKIEYIGLDLQVTDVPAALPLLLAKLRELGAPQGTVIEESRADGPTIRHAVE